MSEAPRTPRADRGIRWICLFFAHAVLFIGSAALAGNDSWTREVAGQSQGRIDSHGFPVLDDQGYQVPMYPEGFQPSILALGERRVVLRFRASYTAEPPETDFDGFPILGDYFNLKYVVLDPDGKWTLSAPITSTTEDIRAPKLTPIGEDAFAVYYLTSESVKVVRFNDGEPVHADLPIVADEAAVAVDEDGTMHAVWTDESGLWYQRYDETPSGSPVQLAAETAVSPHASIEDEDATGIVYVVTDDEGGETSEIIYRRIEDGVPDSPEVVVSMDGTVAYLDYIADSSEGPHIAYVDPGSGDIKVADRSDGEWSIETLAESYSDPGPLAIARESGGGLAFAFAADGGSELRFIPVSGEPSTLVNASDRPGFFAGVDLSFMDSGAPLIVTAESGRLFLNSYTTGEIAPLFDPANKALELSKNRDLDWPAGDGAYELDRLEHRTHISDTSTWSELEFSDRDTERFHDDAGRPRLRMSIEGDEERLFIRAIYRNLIAEDGG